MTPPGRPLAVLAAAILAAALALPARAPADEVPLRNQALLLLRVAAYDRNLTRRVGSSVTVVVLFRAGDRASEQRRDALVRAFEDVAQDVVVAGLPVRAESVAYQPSGVRSRLEALHPALAYVDAALADSAGEIVAATRERHVLSAHGSSELATAGVAVGILPRAGRAGVVVNLPAARQEGADLDPTLLAVAEVLRN